MPNSYQIAVIPGDGTGLEVVNEGRKVLQAAASKFGFQLKLIDFEKDRFVSKPVKMDGPFDSLEIAKTRVIFEEKTIAGNVLMPFFTKNSEGFDVNTEYDWQLAEHMVQKGEAKLPNIGQPAYSN